MTRVPQSSCKAVLLVVLALLVAGRAADTRETQEEGQMEKRHGQNQTDMMKLLKSLEARMAKVENQRMILIRGKPGRPGKAGQRGPPGPKGDRGSGGVQYVRWGKTTCPWGASLVYKGRIGGERYSHPGGGANYVCLPDHPKYARYRSGYQNSAFIYGAEYELYITNPFRRNLQDHEAPCVVCYVTTRNAKMMIPATYECPSGWTREYHGYLMTAGYDHAHSSEFICVDENIEAVPGTHANRNGALLYPVEGVCGSLPCLPYVKGRELTCAVCTK